MVHPPSQLPESAHVAPAETPTLASLLSLAVAVVVVAALYLGRDVLVPIMLAILLSLILTPLVSGFRKLRFGRVPAVIVSVIFALGVLISVGTIIGSQVASLADDAPRYVANIQGKVSAIRQSAVGRLPDALGRLSRQVGGDTPKVLPVKTDGEATRPMPVEVHTPPKSPLETIGGLLAPIVGPLETTVIVLVMAIFILLQREDLRDRVIRLFGSHDLHRTTTAMDDAAARLSRYFLTQLALNSAFGAAVAVALYFIGVPSPILWGVLATLMRFVPYIGTFIAAVPPIVLAAAVGPDWSMAIAVAALFAVSEPLMGYVVEPMVYGHSTGLSPAAIIIAAIFWTWLWGPIGLILSTPLTLCLVVLGRHVERLEFLDVLLGDRPALTPAESFYQRMLADDPDEALDQAETLLKARSLSSYYDEVALEGLLLATNDFHRGTVSPRQLDGIKGAANALIADLDTYDDVDPAPEEVASEPLSISLAEQALPVEPAPEDLPNKEVPDAWRSEGAVLCIAARGPLDEVSAMIMAQLLGKHGIGASALPHASASRQQISQLQCARTLMVFVCAVEISGSPSYLRYMVRRIRDRLQGVEIAFVRWKPDLPGTNNGIEMASIGDFHFRTVREAVSACIASASSGRDLHELIDQLDQAS